MTETTGNPVAPGPSGAPFPPPWGNVCPRAVVAPGTGEPLEATRVRASLGHAGRVEARLVGFVFNPWIRHGGTFGVTAGGRPRAGDLVLCAEGDSTDLRRVLDSDDGGGLRTALDTCPGARETVSPANVLGTVCRRRGAGDVVGRVIAATFPVWSRVARLAYVSHRLRAAPRYRRSATESIDAEFAGSVDGYSVLPEAPIGDAVLGLIRRHVHSGGSVLVAGCGAGGEALHLDAEGYRVTAFDLVPAMVDAARERARALDRDIVFFAADMAQLDTSGPRFDGIYVTPLVYSMVSGRRRRVECLRRLGCRMEPGATLIFSVRLAGRSERWKADLAWLWRRLTGAREASWGDAYNWVVTRSGNLDTSFRHAFLPRHVVREARRAGFRTIRREYGNVFVVTDFESHDPGG